MRNIIPKKIEAEMPMAEGPRLMYPHFSIGMEHLQEARNWDLKKTYKVILELEMTGKSINEHEGKEVGYADFDITGIEVINPKKEFKILYKE